MTAARFLLSAHSWSPTRHSRTISWIRARTRPAFTPWAAPATVSGSSFYNNSAYLGSAIYVSDYFAGMTLTISDSTFVNNSSLSGGTGAIFNSSGATLNIHDSTFWNNIAGISQGGAFYNAGTMTVTDSVVGAPGISDGSCKCATALLRLPCDRRWQRQRSWRRHSEPFAFGQLRWPDRDHAARRLAAR